MVLDAHDDGDVDGDGDDYDDLTMSEAMIPTAPDDKSLHANLMYSGISTPPFTSKLHPSASLSLAFRSIARQVWGCMLSFKNV